MKTFFVTSEDLETLERLCPSIANDLFPVLAKLEGVPGGANRIRGQLRQVKEILSNVRWEYGPPRSCSVIETLAEDGPE